MLPLFGILISGTLLGGFIVLTVYETRHGVRFFDAKRTWLDRQVGRVLFILKHVDLAAFLREEIEHFAHRVVHDMVHLSLQLVRAIERLLTRVIRSFRIKQEENAPRESAREFVKTLSDFKEQLKATPPEVPEIQ